VPGGTVIAVHRSLEHTFSKARTPQIELLAGLGVEGDCHLGARVQHRSRVAADPTQPNLRQVHLIQSELLRELAEGGFAVAPGDLGENITTRGLDLLSLPTGSLLRIGERALVALTGLRNPCKQIHDFQPGLLAKVLERGVAGEVVRKAGVMGVVVLGGAVRAGDPIEVAMPPEPTVPLEQV
jgi:MOSC domain-containing protein YiiM